MIGTAILALSLVPVAWVMRERQQMLHVQAGMLRAREEAIRSVLLAERRRVELRARAGLNDTSAEEPDLDGDKTQPPSVTPEILIEHLSAKTTSSKTQSTVCGSRSNA